jgi:hypothetical protein
MKPGRRLRDYDTGGVACLDMNKTGGTLWQRYGTHWFGGLAALVTCVPSHLFLLVARNMS